MKLFLVDDDDCEQFCFSESSSSTTVLEVEQIEIHALLDPPTHLFEISVTEISHIVKVSTHLRHIEFKDESESLHCVVAAVCEALLHSTAQQKIHINFHFMHRTTNEQFLPIANLMRNCKREIGLFVSFCGESRDDRVSDLLADALKLLASAVTRLSLNFCGVGDDEACVLAENLIYNTTLTHLNFAVNEIGDKGAEALADALKHNGVLTELDLSHNSIGKKGGVALGDALLCNRALEQLDLGGNEICDEGAIALAAGLSGGSFLKELCVDDAEIGKKGGVALGEALAFNSTLGTLNVNENPIGDEGVVAIAGALVRNITLKMLIARHVGMSTEGCSALAGALRCNTSLTLFDISQNEIGDEGVAALADALKDNMSLEKLGLENCEIGDVGAIALAEGIACNVTLNGLGLCNNDITVEVGITALVDGLNRNSTLTIFFLDADHKGIEFALRRNRTLLKEPAWMKRFSDQDIFLKGKVLSKAMERYSMSEFSELTFLFLKSQVSTITETAALSHPAGGE